MLTNENIKELAILLDYYVMDSYSEHKSNFGKNLLDRFAPELQNVPPEQLIAEIVPHNGPIQFALFMFAYFPYWKDLPFQKWQEVLEKIKNRPIALYSFLSFAHRYLVINIVKHFLQLDDVEQEVRLYVLDAIEGTPLLFTIREYDLHDMNKFELDIKLFESIGKRLVPEGAFPLKYPLAIITEPQNWTKTFIEDYFDISY